MRNLHDNRTFVVRLTSSALCIGLILGITGLVGCTTRSADAIKDDPVTAREAPTPTAMAPQSAFEGSSETGRDLASSQSISDLTDVGAVSHGTAEVEIIDTTTFEPQIQAGLDWDGRTRMMKEVLPPHQRHGPKPKGTPNDLPVGELSEAARTIPGAAFPGIDLGQSGGWVPPDPTLAVGPEHIVMTVNMTIGFYSKDGTLEFSTLLNHHGNPGFFEPVGAGGFTFDPKCFYDHHAQRFVVIAPEVYGDSQTAWIDIAVSDDSNPHGLWYKYRTDCVIAIGDTTYWLDYPGVGYDQDAIYVTGNLFGLNQGGWGGVLFRVFDKAPLLVGDDASYADLRDGGAASVQVAHHFGTPQAPFFVSVNNTSSLRIHAILDPLTNPTLIGTSVTVPHFEYTYSGAPNIGGVLNVVDSRIFNVQWRDGNLYATHTIQAGGKNFARWYHLQTNNWPSGGNVSWIQSGNIGGGTGVHTFFPAIYSNKYGNVGVVLASCSADTTPAVQITGRIASDPDGTMGALIPVIIGPSGADGRWGDYFDITVAPRNDAHFWVIGEYADSSGWATWITDFSIITCPGDLDTDGEIGLSDLALLLSNYGTTVGATYDDGDLDEDGDVDLADLAELLGLYGTICS